MNLSYGRIEALLKLTLQVSPARYIALKGRLKHFQRAGFPPNTNVGRGPRAMYGSEETAAIIFAFELQRLRVPPLAAVQIITDNWIVFRRMFLLGWRGWLNAQGAAIDTHPRPKAASMDPLNPSLPAADQRFFAVIFSEGLEDLRGDGGPTRAKDQVRIVAAEELAAWLTAEKAPPAAAVQLLDFMSVVGRALDALITLGDNSPKHERAYTRLKFADLANVAMIELASKA